MAISSVNELCNMALQHLGNYGSINNIVTPITANEKIFNLQYDVCRQSLLMTTMPNFALARKVVAQIVLTPAFGYKYAYKYPNDCLKLLGVGNIDEKLENRISVEGNRIYSDEDYADGMEIRYIKDVTDVNAMNATFKTTFAIYLAEKVCLPITQDLEKKQLLAQMLPAYMANLSAINAQENPPIRRSESRFRASRHYQPAMNKSKK